MPGKIAHTMEFVFRTAKFRIQAPQKIPVHPPPLPCKLSGSWGVGYDGCFQIQYGLMEIKSRAGKIVLACVQSLVSDT